MLVEVEDLLWITLAGSSVILVCCSPTTAVVTGDYCCCWHTWMCFGQAIWFLVIYNPTTTTTTTTAAAAATNSVADPPSTQRDDNHKKDKGNGTIEQQQQQQSNSTTTTSNDGIGMGIVMVPTLLQAMTIQTTVDDKNGDSDNNNNRILVYAKLAVLMATPTTTPPLIIAMLCWIAITLFGDTFFEDNNTSMMTTTTTNSWMFIAIFFVQSWHTLNEFMNESIVSKSFTLGELRSVYIILSILIVEWMKWLFTPWFLNWSYLTATEATTNQDDDNNNDTIPSMYYTLVALSGSIGCLCFCSATSSYMNLGGNHSTWWQLFVRLFFNVIGPMMAVEFSLFWVGFTQLEDSTASVMSYPIHTLPLALQWLYMFLLEDENGYPRYWGLVYWMIILVITSIPTYYLFSLPPKQKISVVVTRKWFHLIAVLLFGPITYQFPQLMSLSYAIAVCVLIVLETVRRDLPWMQSFYTTFIDDRKDDGDHIIVSHMFLILGCAAPLWVIESINNSNQQQSSSSLLVSLFGVICIGIGDAMGAVVGKAFGKHQWGKNHRTVEGSLAMWVSMMLAGICICSSSRELLAFLVASTFTTILEAFTIQLDNLALPLAGCAVVLMLL